MILSVLSLAAAFLLFYRVCVKEHFDAAFFYFFFFFLDFGVRPAFIAFSMDTPFPESLFLDGYYDEFIGVCLITVVWLLSFIPGYLIKSETAQMCFPIFPSINRNYSVYPIIIASVLLTSISLFMISKAVISAGGFIQAMIEIRIKGTLFGDFKFLKAIPLLSNYLSAITLLLILLHKTNLDRKLLALALIIFPLNILLTLVTGDRSGVVFPMVILFFGLSLRLTNRKRIFSFIVAGIFFVSLPLGLHAARNLATGQSETDLTQKYSSLARSLTKGLNLNNFDFMLLVYRDWATQGNMRYGEDFVNGTLGVIPRAIWKEKPTYIHPGHWFQEHYRPESEGGWPIAAHGQWYLNYHFFGVILGGFLSGIFYKSLNTHTNQLKKDPLSMAVRFILTLHFGGIIAQTPILFILWCIPMHLLWIACRQNPFNYKLSVRTPN
ncbi:O-antigen polymerase [Ketobacter alkanivorans]|uniref:Oligosaccharide repeat unit polymerase n=1 Tax=Ketobacter alkanivorans TaxID=1917421 RepID=A0A2K9LNC5_9GAMM|nr:O-antigen polymerase [Ketobacter alkanivorans]AUM13750.1 hypothetical protein Kalk_15545 [Ketobacter alkanivorans]